MTEDSKSRLQPGLIVAIAVAVRLYGLGAVGLWYDELQSVTHAILPVKALIRSVWIRDPHPPLYYLQLHFWMLIGQSDVWILLNSVLWGALATASIYYTANRLFSRKVAIVASLLFAIAPYAVAYAQEARPYAWLMFLAVWCWYFNHRFLFERPRLWEAAGVLATTLAFIYSHGSGFLLLATIHAYVGMSLLRDRVERSTLLKWIALQSVIAVVFVPWLLHAFRIRGFVGHATVPNADSIPDTLWTLIFGFVPAPSAWIEATAVLLTFGLLIVGMIRVKRLAFFALPLVFSPMIVCAAISFTLQPLWMHRTFAFTMPFICIALAMLLTTEPDRAASPRGAAGLRRAGQLAIPAALLFALVVQQMTFVRVWVPRTATRYIQQKMSSTDIVYSPGFRFFWGVSWYLAGPGSVRTFGNDAKSARAGDLLIVTGDEIREHWHPGQNYWVIYRDTDTFDHQPDFERLELRKFDRITVEHVRLRPESDTPTDRGS